MRSLGERFWEKVNIRNENECWNWLGTKIPSGYGRIRLIPSWEYTHRVSWVLAYGKIPEGMCVCHKCDNPSCVNPRHLFLGTVKDNMIDRNNKGRGNNISRKGFKREKLTWGSAKDIRTKYPNISKRQLSIEYRVCIKTICDIINNKSWRVKKETTDEQVIESGEDL